MAGIVSFGAYIPLYRLSRQVIGSVWGSPGGSGERAVCNFDEDSITMAVEAVLDCLSGTERQLVDGLYFASATPPYLEKQSASIVAAACDLRSELVTADFANSLRAGTSALKCAIDAVNSGSAKNFVVVAADCRLPAPDSPSELFFGDGAASFLVGDSEVAVSIEGSYTTSSEFIDTWRTQNDAYIRTWEERFVLEEGFLAHVSQAVSELTKRYNLTAKDFDKVVLYAPNSRAHRDIARSLGFDLKTQVQEPMFDTVGHTGAAFAMMGLVAALEDSKPGDRILFVNYSDGVDAYILRTTENIVKIKDRRGIKRHLASKVMLPTYGKYVRFRNLMQWEAERRPPDPSSVSLLWRERKQLTRFRGYKCKQCGTIQWPMQRVCTWCQAKDEFDEIRLSDKRGILFTFSMDERAAVVDLPDVICIVDLVGGGRFWCKMTDRDPKNLQSDMQVELTFRKMHEGQGLHNYFWKARPVRCT